MNWFRPAGAPNPDDPPSAGEPSSTPDPNELRRRRLAKLEEAQAAEKARRKDLEERRLKWEAERVSHPAPPSNPVASASASVPMHTSAGTSASASASASASTSASASASASALSEPVGETPAPVKRAPVQLPSVQSAVSGVIERALGVTTREGVGEGLFVPEMVQRWRQEGGVGEGVVLYLEVDSHADDVLLDRINAIEDPLAYLFGCYSRCGVLSSEVNASRRIAGEEHKERRIRLHATVAEVLRRVMTYAGMLLNGAFMDKESVTPAAFAERMLGENVPAGFVRKLLHFFADKDGPGLDDVLPVFTRVFAAIRMKAAVEMRLSGGSFLRPLKALLALLQHKELCLLLIRDKGFVPEVSNGRMRVIAFMSSAYLVPFFSISALPGLPVHMPTRPEDPGVARSMFPNPSMMDRATAEGAIFSLRSSISVARSFLYQVVMCLCKAGAESRNAVLTWFGTVLNLNRKRSAMRVDYTDVSGDGFMLNVMHVLLKLCDPIVAGGWEKLKLVDATYPQSSHRLDYEDETRLAADSDMLKRWWVDKRNENAQESLTRHLAAAARESAASASASAEGMDTMEAVVEKKAVSTSFNFVTECFWLALRSVQLGFIAVETMYEESILQTLRRMRDAVRGMEASKDAGTLQPNEAMQLTMLKQRMETLSSTKLCYDVYVQDTDTLTTLVRFACADAEWLMRKLSSDPSRESLLPLPVPVDPTFASLPEHTVESITTVLLTTMRFRPEIVDENSAMLEDIVSFCIVGAASPLHVKNPYLRAKLVEFLFMVFPRGTSGIDDDDDDDGYRGRPNAAMEALFAGHALSRQFLPGALFRLYVDVEHTGSHTQFYDKFSIRYRIGSIVESLWYMTDYRKSVRNEARDETRFLRFVNMVLNDANHLLDSVLDDLEEMHTIETMMERDAGEWQGLTDEEKQEKQERLSRLGESAKSHNLLANNNVKLLWLLTDDEVVRRIFLRDEMVSRLAEMLNYLLERLCGQRCRDLVVREQEKVCWKPRQLLTRIVQTYVHFGGDKTFAQAVGRDGRSYKKELLPRAIRIARKRRLVSQGDLEGLQDIADMAEQALEADNAEEEELGEIPEEFLDPIMSSLMRNPVRLPTSGNVMDRAVISRILLSDKLDPFNRELLTEDMLEDVVELKQRIDAFISSRRRQGQGGTQE